MIAMMPPTRFICVASPGPMGAEASGPAGKVKKSLEKRARPKNPRVWLPGTGVIFYVRPLRRIQSDPEPVGAGEAGCEGPYRTYGDHERRGPQHGPLPIYRLQGAQRPYQ